MRQLVVALLVALWLGAALLLAASVAPAAFAVLPSRALAGALVGRVLPVVFIGGLAVAVIAIALDATSGTTPLRNLRLASAGVMAVVCTVAQFIITPKIEEIPRRADFGRLHGLSVACLGVAILASVALIFSQAIAPNHVE